MEAEIKEWLQTVAPYIAIFVSLYIAIRVQAVHKLVNSEMDQFRATLKRLAEANEASVFRAGQQNVRDANRNTVVVAGQATRAAAEATTAAASAVEAVQVGRDGLGPQ